MSSAEVIVGTLSISKAMDCWDSVAEQIEHLCAFGVCKREKQTFLRFSLNPWLVSIYQS